MIRQASGTPNYTMGFSDELLETFRRFAAEANPAHLLPYLRPGLRVLDFGCGPGTISVGLSKAAAPCELHGVDVEESQIYFARSLAETNGLNIAIFHLGQVTVLTFNDGFFDNAHPQMGKDMKKHLLNAGFANIRRTASFAIYSTPADVAFIHRITPDVVSRSRDHGAGDQVRPANRVLSDAIAEAYDRWKEHLGALCGVAFGEAVANKPYHARNADLQANAE